jgi:HlyD family secretion protein
MAKADHENDIVENGSSPEGLDVVLKVTTPKGWLVLLGLGAMLVVFTLWGIFGSIPTRVTGQGILIKSGGVFDIVAFGSGQLTAMYADVDDVIEKGQLVARIAQLDLTEKIKNAQAELAALEAEHKRIVEFANKDIQMNKRLSDNQRANLRTSIQFGKDRLKWLREKLKGQKELAKEGLITKQQARDTQKEIDDTIEAIEKNRTQMEQISIEEFQFRDQKGRDIRNSLQKISLSERKITTLEAYLDENSKVRSPYSGRILEIKVDEGRTVTLGEPILSLELVGKGAKDLEAVIYVAPGEGKKVRPGMRVHISPSTVNREEYGYMLGKVTRVAEFPATPQGMMRLLQNENLVKALSIGGAPIQIYADLTPDPRTQSGFKWSSPKGPPTKIQSGTICSAAVTVSEQPPIAFVIPLFRRAAVGVREKKGPPDAS